MKRGPTHHGSNIVTDLDAASEMRSTEPSMSTPIPLVPIVQGFPDVRVARSASSAVDAVGDEQSEVILPPLLGIVPVLPERSQRSQDESLRDGNSQHKLQGVAQEIGQLRCLTNVRY